MKKQFDDINLRLGVEDMGLVSKNVINILECCKDNYLYKNNETDQEYLDSLLTVACHELEKIQENSEKICNMIMGR